MKITIILNNKKKTWVLIPGTGKYSFEFEFPDSKGMEGECSVEIIPERSYVPRKLGINNDERTISVILNTLTLIDNTAMATQFINKSI